tara:strand:+ start:27678 stop:28400 length:723 start_codon:yes stop_codon:yes gene_type:complete
MLSIKEIKQKAYRKREDPIYAFMDYLAYYPAKLFLLTSITPNQITIIWILGQLLSALLLTTGNPTIMLIGIVSFQAMFILDCTDGIVARYKKQFSLNGVYLDNLGSYICNATLLLSFSIGVSKLYNDILYLVIGLVLVGIFLINKAGTVNPGWYGNPQQQQAILATQKASGIKNQKKILYYVFAFLRLEYFFNLMFWGTLLGYAQYVLIIYTLAYLVETTRKLSLQFIKNQKLDKKLQNT